MEVESPLNVRPDEAVGEMERYVPCLGFVEKGQRKERQVDTSVYHALKASKVMTALRESSGSFWEKKRETHVVSSATIPPPSGKTCTVKLSSGPRLSLAALTTPYRSQAKKLPDAVRRLTEDEPES